MRHYLSVLLIICFVFFGSGMNANVNVKNIQDTSLTDTMNLTHEVSRISSFQTIVTGGNISTEKTKVGELYIENNTMDGFEVTVSSAEKGVLKPTSTDDGETDIPFSLSLEGTGEVGTGMTETTTISSSDLGGTAHILAKASAGSSVSRPTDITYDLFVNIVDNSNILGMAGTYTDTITLTYTDL